VEAGNFQSSVPERTKEGEGKITKYSGAKMQKLG